MGEIVDVVGTGYQQKVCVNNILPRVHECLPS
jgi:hypothetical protein